MESIAVLITDIDEDGTLDAVRTALGDGADPLSIIEQLREGMAEVGRRFEAKEYYLPDLIMSSEIFKGSIALIEPHLTGAVEQTRGAVVMGTVKGDIHDIGKDIVVTMLRVTGFDVHDIGVDQPPEAFVGKARETGAKVVGLSGLLTVAFDSMKQTVEAFESAGMRDTVKIIIGGGPVNETVVEYAGADAWGKDPAEAIRLAEGFLA
ncbi:MAG: cobalamin B12-binding domain-containing protein [Candidatus Geothermincolia bacterium]